jgi:antitoxin component YwqK of YwqJK toxin-antitoxin module
MRRRFWISVLTLLTAAAAFAQQEKPVNQMDEDGRKHGAWIKKDNKGNVMYEGQFRHGMPVDTFRYYYPDEKLKARAVYDDNGKSVFMESFYKNGNKKAEGKYIDKEKDSVWRFYRKEGPLVSEEHYKADKLEGVAVYYYFDGDTLKTTDFKVEVPDCVEKV